MKDLTSHLGLLAAPLPPTTIKGCWSKSCQEE